MFTKVKILSCGYQLVHYFQISCLYIIAHEQVMSTLQFYGNIAEMATHTQAVDTRLFLSSHATWVPNASYEHTTCTNFAYHLNYADLVYHICVLCFCRWVQWKRGCWGGAGGKEAEEGSACGSHPA